MNEKADILPVHELLSPYGQTIAQDLQRWIAEPACPPELAEAMRYCTLGGGKRLRPALVHITFDALGGPCQAREMASRSAVAVELVHCYSLVHDDLPAMDNDTLRRGLPTAHVKFGQAMAVLAGDALLTRAFAVLAEAPGPLCGPLVGELALAAGPSGMIAGQVADMKLCRLPAGAEGLHYIHLRKTAAMIRAAVKMGAICAGAGERTLAAVGDFGQTLGLAFQLFDDLLDATGSPESLGKTPGKDAQDGKRTYVAEVGLEEARKLGQQLTGQAVAHLACLGPGADGLRNLALSLARRTN